MLTLEIEDIKDLIQMVDLLIKRNSIENEKVNPSITIVVQLCDVLNLQLNQLIKK